MDWRNKLDTGSCVFLPRRASVRVLVNQLAQPETFVQLADQQQASVGGDFGALEINLQGGAKREVKRLVSCLTHWVEPSGEMFWPSKPHEHWCCRHHKCIRFNYKKEIRVKGGGMNDV